MARVYGDAIDDLHAREMRPRETSHERLPRRRQIATPVEQLNKYQLWRGNSIARGLGFARREVALRSPP